MECFRSIVAGSGFEEVIFQAGICASGSLRGIVNGKHYNRAWLVHEAFAEAINQLFFDRNQLEVPDDLQDLAERGMNEMANREAALKSETFQQHSEEYEKRLQDCLAEEYGRTPQFWMYYAAAVGNLQNFCDAISQNDFDLRLPLWKFWLPLCFMLNKVHYARYGSYYCFLLEHLEENYPGAREEIEEKGLSVRRNNLGIGQGMDLAGERTFMKHKAKTACKESFNIAWHDYEVNLVPVTYPS